MNIKAIENYVTYHLVKAKKQVKVYVDKGLKGYMKGYATGNMDAMIFFANFLELDPDTIGEEYN